MANLAKYSVELEAEISRYNRKLDQANKRLKRFEQQNQKSLDNVKREFITFGAAVSVALAVRGLARFAGQAADTMTLVENRLKLVTDSTQELHDVQSRLFSLAQDTRTAFAPTVDLYARMARSTRDLGIADSELIDLTRTVNQAIQISGATAAESSAGVIQFAQALASNRLGGDELRSVLEQMPRLARALADGLHVSIGELRALAKEGKLTTEAIVGALQTQAPKIAKEFEKVNPTIASATTTLKNSLLDIIDDINDATGASSALADSIIGVADAITDLSNIIDPADVTRAEAITNELEELRNPTLFDSLKNGLRGIGDVVNAIRNPSAVHTAAMTLGMNRIDVLEGELEAIEERANRMRGLAPIIAPKLDTSALTDKFAKWEEANEKAIDRLADHFVTSFATAEQEMQRELKNFNLVVKLRPELFSDEDIARIRNQIRMDGLESFDLSEIDAKQKAFLADRAEQMRNELGRIKTVAEDIGLTFASAFEDAIVQARNLKDIVHGLLQDIIRIIVRKKITEPLANFIGGLFDGKAMGGPVAAGVPYLVGERGPELFVPGAAGRIVPNGQFGGGVSIVNHISADGFTEAQLAVALQRNSDYTVARIAQMRQKGRM